MVEREVRVAGDVEAGVDSDAEEVRDRLSSVASPMATPMITTAKHDVNHG